jgi:hypothetical protein
MCPTTNATVYWYIFNRQRRTVLTINRPITTEELRHMFVPQTYVPPQSRIVSSTTFDLTKAFTQDATELEVLLFCNFLQLLADHQFNTGDVHDFSTSATRALHVSAHDFGLHLVCMNLGLPIESHRVLSREHALKTKAALEKPWAQECLAQLQDNVPHPNCRRAQELLGFE